jgi:peptidyl-prolyl cis-trans isomerase SurA
MTMTTIKLPCHPRVSLLIASVSLLIASVSLLIARVRFLIVGCAAVLALAAGVSPLQAQSVACMVNGEPITNLDIEQRTKLNFLTTRKQMPRQEVIEELTNEKVKIKEAKKFGVDPSASDIDQAYAGMSSRMRLSADQLTK